MVSGSERPTCPPAFDVVQFAKDSDARLASARPRAGAAESDDWTCPKSETRLVTRTTVAARAQRTDEDWARGIVGAPVLVVGGEGLRRLPLDHHAGFVVSLMDGSMDLETLVELSGMDRQDALRLVRALFEAGLVAFR